MSDAYQLLVFDWDGTLMDSEARIVSCIQAASADLGAAPLEAAVIRDIIGLGLHEAVAKLYPGSDFEFHDRLASRYRQHYLHDSSIGSGLFDGVGDMLESLRTAGKRLAVATGKSRVGLEQAFRETGTGGLFEVSRCADETESKPHPRMLLEIMRELDASPGTSLMIGDTEYDMLMARNADVAGLAVSYGVHEEQRLRECDPVDILANVAQLRAWLHGAGDMPRG